MRNLDGSDADIQWRRDDFVSAEPLEREDRADNVDDGVKRRDFVQMHVLDGHVVNRGLGLADPLKERDRSRLAGAPTVPIAR